MIHHHWISSILAGALLAGLAGTASGQTANDITLTTSLISNVQHTLDAVPVNFVVKPGTYAASNVTVDYVVYDLFKNPVGQGTFDLALTAGQEARRTFSFTPPANGWYTVETQVSSGGTRLLGKGLNVGVTPSFAGLPDIALPVSNLNDQARNAFSGQRIDRINTSSGSDPVLFIHQMQYQADQRGINLIVQFEGAAQATDLNHIAARATEFKGKVKYWEIWNEPNFGTTPENYANVLKNAYQTIKAIDPDAKVLGPALVSVDLNWYTRFLKAGGGQYLDIVSVHDYEGNEAIDPGHWRWKFGAFKDLLTQYGVGDKEIWQTERAIGGVRGKLFLGGVQAVRQSLHTDLLATLGIPNEHNYLYYMTQHGYSSVPTYMWSNAGPNPAALVLRTREAMVRGRDYTHTLSFGPTGDKIYFALNYDGDDGSTVILRNYGTLDRDVSLNVTGGSTVNVVDSFGNERTLNVVDGKVNVTTSALPVYLRLAEGQSVAAPNINFGENIASLATFSFSGQTGSNSALLTNGIFEAQHPSNPNKTYWEGTMGGQAQTLTMTFAQRESIDKAIVYSVRADNPYCALLDYDLQYWDGNGWVTLEQIRTPVGETDVVSTQSDAAGNTWYMDQNFFVHEFAPILTDRLRLVALRVTNGFQPDDIASGITGWYAHGNPQLMLREIEVYRAVPEPALLLPIIAALLALRRRTGTVGRDTKDLRHWN